MVANPADEVRLSLKAALKQRAALGQRDMIFAWLDAPGTVSQKGAEWHLSSLAQSEGRVRRTAAAQGQTSTVV